MAGDFVCMVDGVDYATTWVELRPIWGHGQAGTLVALKDIEANLPFSLLGLDSDNGGEFLNQHVLRWLQQRRRPVFMTRSRPYKKDDNAHVEQKNWSAVRPLLGYERLDNPQGVAPLDDLYQNEWHWLVNFFCPTFKLIDKKKVGSKYVKRYEKPRTPYARLLESAEVPRKEKQKLRAIREGLDPVKLRWRIEQKLRRLFAINRAVSEPAAKEKKEEPLEKEMQRPL